MLLAGDFECPLAQYSQDIRVLAYLDGDTLVAISDLYIMNPMVRPPHIHPIRNANVGTCIQ